MAFLSNAVKSIALGQLLSLLVAVSGLMSTLLVRKHHVHAPTAQSFLNYTLLATVYGALLTRGGPIQLPWYLYLLIAFFDVEATWLFVKAFQFTSITSVMLLVCWTIPCVMVLTRWALKTRYKIWHFVGGSVCVAGLLVVVFSDVHAMDRATQGSHVLRGDVFVVAGSMIYAALNVSEEFVVKNVNQVEYLAHVGFFGAIVSACQLLLFERKVLASVDWNVGAVMPLLTYAACSFCFASLLPRLLQMSGSTMVNLSLLTSNMWAVAIRALGFHESVDSLYFAAFALVAVGLLLYSAGGEPSCGAHEGGGGGGAAAFLLGQEVYEPIDEVDKPGDPLVSPKDLSCLDSCAVIVDHDQDLEKLPILLS